MKPEEAKPGIKVITPKGRRGVLGKIFGDGTAGAYVIYETGFPSVMWVKDLKLDEFPNPLPDPASTG